VISRDKFRPPMDERTANVIRDNELLEPLKVKRTRHTVIKVAYE
jgi:hypothetical protein